MAEIVITKENFEEEVLKSDKPVILDFWAEWCGPCRMLAPVIAEIAEENEGRLKVGKVNVDDQPELANKFRVSGIPTVIAFENGKMTGQKVGYRPKEDILSLVEL